MFFLRNIKLDVWYLLDLMLSRHGLCFIDIDHNPSNVFFLLHKIIQPELQIFARSTPRSRKYANDAFVLFVHRCELCVGCDAVHNHCLCLSSVGDIVLKRLVDFYTAVVSRILTNYLPLFLNLDMLISQIQSCKNMNLVLKRIKLQ